MSAERTIVTENQTESAEREKAERIRLVYSIEKIRSLLPPTTGENITALKCATTDTLDRLKLALKIISQMHIIDSLYGGLTGIDENETWERWGKEGYSELFGIFYIANYQEILETPERAAELFEIYRHDNSDLPPFRSRREPINSEV